MGFGPDADQRPRRPLPELPERGPAETGRAWNRPDWHEEPRRRRLPRQGRGSRHRRRPPVRLLAADLDARLRH